MGFNLLFKTGSLTYSKKQGIYFLYKTGLSNLLYKTGVFHLRYEIMIFFVSRSIYVLDKIRLTVF